VNAPRQPGGRGRPVFVRALALAAAGLTAASGAGCTPKPQLLPEARAEKVADEAERLEQLAQAPPPPTDVEALRTAIVEEALHAPRCAGTAIYTKSTALEFWYALYGLRTLRGPTDVPPAGLQTYSFTNQWGPQTELRFDSPFQFYSGVDFWRPFVNLIGFAHERRTGQRLLWLNGGRAPRCREEVLKARAEQLQDLPPRREDDAVAPLGPPAPPPAQDPLTDKLNPLQGQPSTPWNTDPANSAPQGPALPLRDVRPQNDNPR